MKRLRAVSMLLAAAVMFNLLTVFMPSKIYAETTIVASGTCEENANISWTLDSEGTLVVSGNGDIPDYSNIYNAETRDWHSYKDQIKSVVINDGITSIGHAAFINSGKIVEVAMANSVTSIGDYAFYYDGGLESVKLPETLTSIGDLAFHKCTNLKNVVIPDSVEYIGEYSFSGCDGFTSITIPKDLKQIGDAAFCECTGVVEVIVPDTVTSLSFATFNHCTNLKKITLSKNLEIINDLLFSDCCSISSVTIPNKVKKIESAAFIRCYGLENINIPSSVIEIEYNAFADCTSLKEIQLPPDLTSLPIGVFGNCKNLGDVIVPSKVKSIGSGTSIIGTFEGCVKSSVYYPATANVNSSKDHFKDVKSEIAYTFNDNGAALDIRRTGDAAVSDGICFPEYIEDKKVISSNYYDYPDINITHEGKHNYVGSVCAICGDTHTHSAAHTAAKAPTCTNDGNKEYWHCAGCDKYFNSEDCTVEITEEETKIPALGHKWSEDWAGDDQHHWHNCTNEGCPITENSEKKDFGKHEWTETRSAEATGSKTCTICGKTVTASETAPSVPEKPNADSTVTTAPAPNAPTSTAPSPIVSEGTTETTTEASGTGASQGTEPKPAETTSPAADNSENSGDNAMNTGDGSLGISTLVVGAFAAVLAANGFMLLFGCGGISEKYMWNKVNGIVDWGRKGGKLRRYFALAVVFVVMSACHWVGIAESK